MSGGLGGNAGFFDQDNVKGIEQLSGSGGDDVMRDLGSNRETWFLGGRGNDRLVASAFDGTTDYAFYSDLTNPADHIEVDLQWQTEYAIGVPGGTFVGNVGVFTGGILTEVDALEGISGIYASAGTMYSTARHGLSSTSLPTRAMTWSMVGADSTSSTTTEACAASRSRWHRLARRHSWRMTDMPLQGRIRF